MVAVPATFSLPNLTGGPALSKAGGDPIFSDRNAINVAPVGVNLGEILRVFEGPPENGGAGLEIFSRYFGDRNGKLTHWRIPHSRVL